MMLKAAARARKTHLANFSPCQPFSTTTLRPLRLCNHKARSNESARRKYGSRGIPGRHMSTLTPSALTPSDIRLRQALIKQLQAVIAGYHPGIAASALTRLLGDTDRRASF